jgi:UDP-glucose 4-epimerase
VAGSFCNANTALKLLNWKAELSVEQGIADALKWGELREKILDFS